MTVKRLTLTFVSEKSEPRLYEIKKMAYCLSKFGSGLEVEN